MASTHAAVSWDTSTERLGGLEPRSPEQIAAALEKLLRQDYDPALRARFLEHYTDRKFAGGMKSALLSLPTI